MNLLFHHQPPVAESHLAEGHRADDERARLRPGIAACRDNQRHENRKHHGFFQTRCKSPDDCRRQHPAEKKHDEPHGALFHQLPHRRIHVGIIQRLGAAEFLDLLGRLLLLHIEHVVNRHDAEQLLPAVNHGQRVAVVFFESLQPRLCGVRRPERDETAVVNIAHQRVRRAQQEFADAHVVNQPPALIRHIHHVQRFRIATVLADVIEHALNRPVVAHGDKIRRHQTAHAALGIIQQRLRDFFFLRRKKLQQLHHRCARQFLQQRRAVVGRHLIQDARRLRRAHRLEQRLLRIAVEILENIRRQRVRQNAEQHHTLILRQFRDQLARLRRREIGKRLAQPREIAARDHLLDFRP